MPKAGTNRKEYLTDKLGSWERFGGAEIVSQALGLVETFTKEFGNVEGVDALDTDG